MNVLAVIVMPSETVTIAKVPAESITKWVGDPATPVYTDAGVLVCWRAESQTRRTTNLLGSMLVQMLGGQAAWPIAGSLLFVGEDAVGGVSDVPLAVLEALPLLYQMAGRAS